MGQKFENKITGKVADACFLQLKPSLLFKVIIEDDKGISVGMDRINAHIFGAGKMLFEITGHHVRVVILFLHHSEPP